MQGDRDDGERRPLRFEEIADPEFQRKWTETRSLTGEQVDLAFRHGFEACERFAERPLPEVEGYLRQSWEAMGPPVPWDQVRDIVGSGYERYLGGMGGGQAAMEVPEAMERFSTRTIGGTGTGGGLGSRPQIGGAERVSDFEGEGGPPVEDGRRIRE